MGSASPFSGARVLITGANGFIGARLAARLSSEGAMVHAVVSPNSEAENLAGNVTVQRADIRDLNALKNVMTRARPSLIYHLASHGNHAQHYRGSATEALVRIAEINVIGTANLLAASADLDFECLINSGSAFAEYGPGDAPMHESQRLSPTTFYGASKAGGTLLVSAFGKSQRKNVITLRPLYVYGPGESAFRFVPTVIAKCLRGETLSLTSVNEKKNFVFIDDVVEAYRLAALTRYKDVPAINIGARDESTLGDVIRLVEDCLGRKISYIEGAYEQLQWPSNCWAADIGLAHARLGWRPTTSLADGIQRTAAWLIATGKVDARPGA